MHTEKALDNIQDSFMIKTFSKQGIKKNLLSLIKASIKKKKPSSAIRQKKKKKKNTQIGKEEFKRSNLQLLWTATLKIPRDLQKRKIKPTAKVTGYKINRHE